MNKDIKYAYIILLGNKLWAGECIIRDKIEYLASLTPVGVKSGRTYTDLSNCIANILKWRLNE